MKQAPGMKRTHESTEFFVLQHNTKLQPPVLCYRLTLPYLKQTQTYTDVSSLGHNFI